MKHHIYTQANAASAEAYKLLLQKHYDTIHVSGTPWIISCPVTASTGDIAIPLATDTYPYDYSSSVMDGIRPPTAITLTGTRVGIFSDLHYPRDYNDQVSAADNLRYLTETMDAFTARSTVLNLSLGDNVYNAADRTASQAAIAAITEVFQGTTRMAVGNHDVVGTLLANWMEDAATWTPDENFTLDVGDNWRIIVLTTYVRTDPCTTSEPWLVAALQQSKLDNKYIIVVSHIRLLQTGDIDPYYELESPLLRDAITSAYAGGAKIRVVMNGHYHAFNLLVSGGIPYYTISSVTFYGNAYALTLDDVNGEFALEKFDIVL